MRLPTDEKRSALMRRVRRRGTSAELTVAALCREAGLSYRLNVKSLPGAPDLANKTKRWAIFVNGCFWHRHKNCRLATIPKRNQAFWLNKFADNRARDARKVKELRSLGFRVAIVWQCEASDRTALLRRLQNWANRVS
ncbi:MULTISPECIES: very short patch repair endonuclease [Methylocystis]|uniref:very short patch repair endonuclease n=1 Tax=Methylocystis TaxID=133 RepID=UPI00192285E6|nr:very short patch repair endonuclease [Methylocystis iwaonis]MBL1256842.1 DNA mismatch endonuclease Vsr [Methylocystis sp. Sn-Cys]